MPIEHKDVTLRIAVVRKGEDPNPDMIWRIYVGEATAAIHAKEGAFTGIGLPGSNFKLCQNLADNGMQGLRAWVEVYGDLSVEDGVATITLKTPPADHA